MVAQVAGVSIGVQPEAPSPYPPKVTPLQVTPGMAQTVSALLTDPLALLPNGTMTDLASGLQAYGTVTQRLTNLVNTGSTVLVIRNAIKNHTPGLALMIAATATSAALTAAGYNPNNIVASAIQRANEIVSSPLQFLEKVFRGHSHTQANFTGAVVSAVLRDIAATQRLLSSIQTFMDLLTGGVTSYIGPNVPTTTAAQRLRAAGISVDGAHIRAGLSAMAQAMRNLGTLWSPSDGLLIGTPNGLVLSLKRQGIAETAGLRQALLNVGVFIDDDLDIADISPFIILNALREIKGQQLQYIVEQTHVKVANPAGLLSAADLCNPAVLMTQEAIDNIPYGDLGHFGQAIFSMGITDVNMWREIADVLDQLELPDVGKITNASFASDMSNLKNYIGPGSGLYGEPQLTDLIGTAAGAVHNEAFAIIQRSAGTILQTPTGANLKTQLDYYDQHNQPSDPGWNSDLGYNPVAVNNLVTAIEALDNGSDPVVTEAVQAANQSAIDSANQLLGEIATAIATGYSIWATISSLYQMAVSVGTAIAATARSLGSDGGKTAAAATNKALVDSTKFPEGFWQYAMTGFKAAWKMVEQISQAVGSSPQVLGMLQSCVNRNSVGGQAILALIAETKNKNLLAGIGVGLPAVDVNNEYALKLAEGGYGLTTDQLNIITLYAANNNYSPAQTTALIKMNSYFGYQRHWFETFAGLYEPGYLIPVATTVSGTQTVYTQLTSYSTQPMLVANLVTWITTTDNSVSQITAGTQIRIFPQGYVDRSMSGIVYSYIGTALVANIYQALDPTVTATVTPNYSSWYITGQ